jgi:hypothetical protein
MSDFKFDPNIHCECVECLSVHYKGDYPNDNGKRTILFAELALATANAKIARYEAALRHYADEQSWNEYVSFDGGRLIYHPVDAANGYDIAREALNSPDSSQGE